MFLTRIKRDRYSAAVLGPRWHLAVAAIVKNERPYLIEWLAHHRCLGVEHFYIADNGSDDGTDTLLAELHDARLLTLTHWPLTEKAQAQWYARVLGVYQYDARYLAFIDVDEFIAPEAGVDLKGRIADLLESESVGALACEWRVFGSSGHKTREPGLVIERFTQAARPGRRVNRHVKSIVKPEAVERMYAHSADLKTGYRYVDSVGDPVDFLHGRTRSGRVDTPLAEAIVIKHFLIKSEQEFVENKMEKGRANLGPDSQRGWRYFVNHDLNDQAMHFPAEWHDTVRREVARLESRLGRQSRP